MAFLFKELISKIKKIIKINIPILLAPRPNEIYEANLLNAKVV